MMGGECHRKLYGDVFRGARDQTLTKKGSGKRSGPTSFHSSLSKNDVLRAKGNYATPIVSSDEVNRRKGRGRRKKETKKEGRGS